MDRPKINFKTAVAEGKKRRHVCSPACVGQENTSFTCCKDVVQHCQAFPNLLGSRAFTEAYRCLKFILRLDLWVLLYNAKRTKLKSILRFYFRW